jgi:L-lactate dehydrogenase complex protein LldE
VNPASCLISAPHAIFAQWHFAKRPFSAAAGYTVPAIRIEVEVMKLALFVPCIVNHFYPEVARDTLELLEKLGHQVSYPPGQTCCGQILTNSGCLEQARPTVEALGEALTGDSCDAVVAPAASCALAARENLERLAEAEAARSVAGKIHELTQFLHDVAPIDQPLRPVRKTISLQMSCHGLRLLGLGTPSELAVHDSHNKLEAVLSRIPELTIRFPSRDECCGFGGTFSVDERDISGKMANDKVDDHVATGADAIVGYDPSCLMSLGGAVSRRGVAIEVLHFSALLNQAI